MAKSKDVVLVELLAGIVESAAKDAGWDTLDRKPYPSDPKLRNCECVGAFVGSIRAQLREAIKAVGCLCEESKGLMCETKDSAKELAEVFKEVGSLKVKAIESQNGDRLNVLSAEQLTAVN